MDKSQTLYEVAYLISPAYSDEEAQNFQQLLKSGLQSLGGMIDNEGEVIKRRLFYPIKKMAEAYLASFRFLIAPEKISALKSKLNSKEVLRFLIVETKRQPARIYRPRIAKIPGAETMIVPMERKIKQTETAAPKPIEPAANIEEIDKKLEEILGK